MRPRSRYSSRHDARRFRFGRPQPRRLGGASLDWWAAAFVWVFVLVLAGVSLYANLARTAGGAS